MVLYALSETYTGEHCQKRGSSRREEGEGDADNGQKSQYHADVDDGLYAYHREYPYADHPALIVSCLHGYQYQLDAQSEQYRYQQQASDETQLFTRDSEDKVVLLLGYYAGGYSGAVAESRASQSARGYPTKDMMRNMNMKISTVPSSPCI